MLIKANHAPLFSVNSYYPHFTLALTNDSAGQRESVEVVGMQPLRAAFRCLHAGLRQPEIAASAPVPALFRRVKRWDVVPRPKNTQLFASYRSCDLYRTENQTPWVKRRLLKVEKDEDALNLPFREGFDPRSGKAERCQSCTLASPVSRWQPLCYEEKNVAWYDLGIAQLSHRALEDLNFTDEVLLKDGSSNILLKTDCPASPKKKKKS